MAPEGFTRMWADQPFQLIKVPASIPRVGSKVSNASIEGSVMAIIHNAFLRSLNSIYLQAPHIKDPNDIKDFMVYVENWHDGLHQHHETEETIVFPLFAKDTGIKDIMEPNINQHAEFTPGLDALHAYIEGVKAGTEPYDGSKLLRIIDSFGEILTRHLTEEIATLQSLEQYDDKIDWVHYSKTVHQAALAHANPEYGVPLFFTNINFTDPIEKSNVPLPWIAKQVFRWWFIPKHPELWRFSSCDRNQIPKELPFAPLLSAS